MFFFSVFDVFVVVVIVVVVVSVVVLVVVFVFVVVVVDVDVVFVVVVNVEIRCLCWLRLSTREECGRGARFGVATGASRPRRTKKRPDRKRGDSLPTRTLCEWPASTYFARAQGFERRLHGALTRS